MSDATASAPDRRTAGLDDGATDATEWTPDELEVITGAVRQVPSIDGTRPWTLEFHSGDGERTRSVSLLERVDAPGQPGVPGRDRLVRCGAALQNLRLATRILGWVPETVLRPGPAGELARVTVRRRRSPTESELSRYSAIFVRADGRSPGRNAVSATTRERLVESSGTDGVRLRPVRDDEVPVLASVLERDTAPGASAARTSPRTEALLVVETPDDGPVDHLRAGVAVQNAWLTATAAGFTCAVITNPLRLPEVRSGLVEGLNLPGFPQAVLRLGTPRD